MDGDDERDADEDDVVTGASAATATSTAADSAPNDLGCALGELLTLPVPPSRRTSNASALRSAAHNPSTSLANGSSYS